MNEAAEADAMNDGKDAGKEARGASFYCEELLAVYEKLDQLFEGAVESDDGNPCESCFRCCAAPVRLHLSALELELLRVHGQAFREEEFLRFVNRPRGGGDASNQIVCPHYSMERHGCTVYHHRPICCRMFGHVPGRSMDRGCAFRRKKTDSARWREIDRVLEYFSELRHSYYCQFRHSIRALTPMDHIHTGNVLIEEGKLELGFREYDLAMLGDPESAIVLSCQARKYEMRGKLHDAEEAYRKALRNDPEDSTLHIKLGFVLYSTNRHREALEQYEKAIKINPAQFMAWGNKGLAYLATGEREKALEAYAKGLELEPTNGTFHVMQGTILESLGDLAKAEASYCRAVVCDESDPLPHLCIGKLCRRLRRFGDAFRAFYTFRELSGESPQAHSVDRDLYEISLIRRGSVNNLIMLALTVHQSCLFIFLLGMDLPL